jgi:hypothetical protein
VIEDVELKLGADSELIGDSGAFKILLGVHGDIARVLVKAFVFGKRNHVHITNHSQRRDFRERVFVCRAKVGNEHHIAVFNRRITIIRAVKADAVSHCIGGETLYRNCKVLPSPIEVEHHKVDHLYFFFSAIAEGFIKCFKHRFSPFHQSG